MKNLSIEKSISDKEEIESVSSERLSTPPSSDKEEIESISSERISTPPSSNKEEIESVSSERISTPSPSSTCVVIHNIVVSDEESNPASPCRSVKIASPSITQEHEEKDFPSSPVQY